MLEHQPLTTVSLDELLKNAPDGVFALDRHRRFVVFNQACERLTGQDAINLIGRSCTCSDCFNCQDEHGRSLSGILCPARAIFQKDLQSARQRMQIRRPDGSTAWIETMYSAVYDDDGQVEMVLGIVRDAEADKAEKDALLQTMASLQKKVRHLCEELSSRCSTEHEIDDASADPNTIDEHLDTKQDQPLEASLSLDPYLQHVERQAILRALRATYGRRSKAAQLMGISRSRLYRRMLALGIDPDELS